MKTFEVEIKEVNTGWITVPAKTEKEAKKKAMEAYEEYESLVNFSWKEKRVKVINIQEN